MRDAEKAQRALPQVGSDILVRKRHQLANDCDIVVECLPPALFRDIAISAIDKGRIFMPLSVAQLLENGDLVERARRKGARILVPTGALIGLDAVRAAAEGTIHSVKMVTRKPPAGLDGAPYLRERGNFGDRVEGAMKGVRRRARAKVPADFPPMSMSRRHSALRESGRTVPSLKFGPIQASHATLTR